jgi:hypothetical protein
MQTFVPYSDFQQSADCLDWRRLGKQRVECLQILNALDSGTGWANHPAVKMWRGYENALKCYGNTMISAWMKRGYNNNMPLWSHGDVVLPPWWGGDIHATHRSNLLRKDPTHYGQFDWSESDNLPYYWPGV